MLNRIRWVLGVGFAVLMSISCGGGPDQAQLVSQAATGDPRTLTLNVSGAGTVTGSYTTGSGNVALFATGCAVAVCTATVPEGAVVTLTGASAGFVGFQRPYCDVNPCYWDDPEWMPPTQNVWSPAAYTFTLAGARSVNAKFALPAPPASPTAALTLNVAGGGTVTGSYAVGASVTTLAACSVALCTYAIPLNASVTLRAAGVGFVGFQVPYCDVNPCYWDDPEWMPPAQYAWSPKDYAFTLAAPKTVNARFTAPAPILVTANLGVDIYGVGTVYGSYVDGAKVIPLTPCSAAHCGYSVPPNASVTLTATASNFVGFQRPYCDVNPCYWDDPEWMPPTQNVWSPAAYTFVLASPKSASAKFGP